MTDISLMLIGFGVLLSIGKRDAVTAMADGVRSEIHACCNLFVTAQTSGGLSRATSWRHQPYRSVAIIIVYHALIYLFIRRVCLCVCMSTTLTLNISQVKRLIMGLVSMGQPVGMCPWRVD